MAELPRATLRLQFHRGFTLDAAARRVPYFARLGVSHLYASPLFAARPGSTHGYDVIDPNRVNPELGGEAALRRLVTDLRENGMGLILDIVPNHMAVGGGSGVGGNAWWQDVLEWGRESPYAAFFDIDWQPPARHLRGKVLAPFLGRPYAQCLAAGEIGLAFASDEGRLFVTYCEHRFPLAPRDYPTVLGEGDGTLAALVRPLATLPHGRRASADARNEALAIRQRLRNPALAPLIAQALSAFDATSPAKRARLHAVLARQAYRLAWWRAADDINWRRFFDITGLAGLRVDQPAVFEATHAGVLRLYAEGLIDGVRVDHIDGLADPAGYLRRLRRRLAEAGKGRPATAPAGPAPVWVEKILAEGETLPSTWDTSGTTGYDFMDQVAAVLHDPRGAEKLTQTWVRASGRAADFIIEERAARRQVLGEILPAEMEAAALAIYDSLRDDPGFGDDGLPAVRRVLAALVVAFPVYRLYARAGRAGSEDRAVMGRAVEAARAALSLADHDLLARMAGWLLGDGADTPPAGARSRQRRAMRRFQQLTAPVAAKSVEDTAFYRYGRLISRNEVGSDPGTLALVPEAFHAAMAERQAHWPHALLATATHDHKRGEDTRARLAMLSEMPELWAESLPDWTRRTGSWRRHDAPDAADMAILFQTILGAWPLDLAVSDDVGRTAFAARLAAWQEKALREAKRHSHWTEADLGYERRCADFLARLMDPARSEGLVAELAAMVARLAPAGALNSLVQTALHLTVPGIPDLYQGTEFWDFSLVDPDNRRPVDFTARDSGLGDAAPAAYLPRWRDGRVKQALICRLLHVRARVPALFAAGGYTPLTLTGRHARHGLAFARTDRAHAVVVVATHLAARLPGVAAQPLVTPAAWEDTALRLPEMLWPYQGAAVLTDSPAPPPGPTRSLAALLRDFPVAVLLFDLSGEEAR
jgi:(1->4)-alpha-D-glucan 1-alpha-D-glucosylmutase